MARVCGKMRTMWGSVSAKDSSWVAGDKSFRAKFGITVQKEEDDEADKIIAGSGGGSSKAWFREEDPSSSYIIASLPVDFRLKLALYFYTIDIVKIYYLVPGLRTVPRLFLKILCLQSLPDFKFRVL